MRPIPSVIRVSALTAFFGTIFFSVQAAFVSEWTRGVFFLLSAIIVCVLWALAVEFFDGLDN